MPMFCGACKGEMGWTTHTSYCLNERCIYFCGWDKWTEHKMRFLSFSHPSD